MAAGTPVLTLYPIANPTFRSLLPNRNATLTICFLVNATRKEHNVLTQLENHKHLNSSSLETTKRSHHYIYVRTALISTLGIILITFLAVYYKFTWQIDEGGSLPYTEMLATFASSIAAAVGMEFLSKWVHRVLWHGSLWQIHQSHHRPRKGRFELNDVFAIINATPAVALLDYGFFHNGLVPGICFGAGVGMTLLGMAYIFVHNGLVHGRFPIHHSTKFKGVPYGLFLGPKELEEVGGTAELEKEMMEKEMNRTIGQMKGP